MMKTNQLDNCDDNIDLKLPEDTKWTEPIYSKGRTLIVQPHKRASTPSYKYTVPGQVPGPNSGKIASTVSIVGEKPIDAKNLSPDEEVQLAKDIQASNDKVKTLNMDR